MGYLPLRDAKLLSHSVNSMRRYSVKIYNEKKEAMMTKDSHANSQRTSSAGSDSDAILSALCRFGSHDPAYVEETDGLSGTSESKH